MISVVKFLLYFVLRASFFFLLISSDHFFRSFIHLFVRTFIHLFYLRLSSLLTRISTFFFLFLNRLAFFWLILRTDKHLPFLSIPFHFIHDFFCQHAIMSSTDIPVYTIHYIPVLAKIKKRMYCVSPCARFEYY